MNDSWGTKENIIVAARKARTQTERREEAEASIILAAARLVAEKGYDGFSLADVGEKAGYSRGLPAHYFGKRDELLKRVAEKIIEDFYDGFSRIPETKPGLPNINALVRHYAASSKTRRVKALVILLARSLVDKNLKPTIHELNDLSLSLLEQRIAAGIDVGNIRPDIDVNVQARLIYSFLRGQLGFVTFDKDYDIVSICESFLAMLEQTIGRKA